MKPSPTLLAAIVAAIVAASLSACSGDTYISDRDGHSLVLRENVLTAHAKGQPDAVVDAAGNLAIGGKPVAVTPAQHALLKAYHDQVADIRRAGIETGKAGAALAGHAVGDVVSGLMHGNSDGISSKIDQRAKEVEAKALALCDDMEGLQKAQEAIAASLPAFKPYATLQVRGDSDCREEAERHASAHRND